MKRIKIKISDIKDICDKKREMEDKMENIGLDNIDFLDDNMNIIEITINFYIKFLIICHRDILCLLNQNRENKYIYNSKMVYVYY